MRPCSRSLEQVPLGREDLVERCLVLGSGEMRFAGHDGSIASHACNRPEPGALSMVARTALPGRRPRRPANST